VDGALDWRLDGSEFDSRPLIFRGWSECFEVNVGFEFCVFLFHHWLGDRKVIQLLRRLFQMLLVERGVTPAEGR